VSSSLKKHIYKTRFLNESLNEAEEICSAAKQEFFNEIRKLQADLNVYDEALDANFSDNKSNDCTKDDPDDKNNKASVEETEDTSDPKPKSSHPSWAKKLYRAITIKTHPDKLLDASEEDKSKKIKMYTRVITAYSNYNYADLVLVAIDLDIPLPDQCEVIAILKIKCKENEEKIKTLEDTLEWVWHHATPKVKKEIIRKFVSARGWTKPGAAMRKSRSTNHPGKSVAWARKKTEQDEV
jgi:transcription elongation factor Elf1